METSFGLQALNNPFKLTAVVRKGRKRRNQVKRGHRSMSKINSQCRSPRANIFYRCTVQMKVQLDI